jgi:RHS repeat-associated protein
LRVQKYTAADGWTTFVNHAGNVILELDLNGAAKARYAHGLGIEREDVPGGQFFYFKDGHGDTVQLVGSNGTVHNTYETDAFGNSTQTGTKRNVYVYAGEYRDAETGLIYLRARYYDPGVGRFISEDPVRSGANWYAYGANDPVNFFDPTGLIPTTEEAAAMNDHIYNPDGEDDMIWPKVELIGGWEFVDYEEKGYFVGIYSKTTDGVTEYALVSKGTDPLSARDWGQNVAQVFGGSTDVEGYIAFANNFIKKEGAGKEVTFVGHSKGGAEAAAAAMDTKRNAILFNPATLNYSAYKLNASDYRASGSSISTHIVKNEPLYQFELYSQVFAYGALGSVDFLQDPYPNRFYNSTVGAVSNALDRHAMWGVREALGDKTGWRVNPLLRQ